MRQWLMASLVVVGMAASGCASIFSGLSQEVTLTSDVPGAKCIVLGGTVGTSLAVASGISAVSQKVFDLMDPVLDAEDRASLRKADLNELITYAAISLSEMEMPKELDSTMRFLKRVPKSIIQKLMDWFAILGTGPFPLEVDLRRARTCAMVAWAPGHKARVVVLNGYRFNWVVLWNLLNFGFGFIIDGATGAWGRYPSPIPIALQAR